MEHRSAAVLLALAAVCLVAPSSGRAADSAVTKCGKSIPWSRFDPDDLGDKVGCVEQYMAGIRWHQEGKRLAIPSWSVAPGYKVMLFPYRHGDELPVTAWNRNRTKLTVEWRDRKDEFTFTTGDDGRTRLVVTRGGEEVIELK